MPDRAYRVDHFSSEKPVAIRDLRAASWATFKPAALLEQGWPRRPVDRSINASSPQQRGIRRIDDRIHLQGGYVGLDGIKHCHATRKIAPRLLKIQKRL